MNNTSDTTKGSKSEHRSTLRVRLREDGTHKLPIEGARVAVFEQVANKWCDHPVATDVTDGDGYAHFTLPGGNHTYGIGYSNAFGFHKNPGEVECHRGKTGQTTFDLQADCHKHIDVEVPNIKVNAEIINCGSKANGACQELIAGQPAKLKLSHLANIGVQPFSFSFDQGSLSATSTTMSGGAVLHEAVLDTADMVGQFNIDAPISHDDGSTITPSFNGSVVKETSFVVSKNVSSMTRTETTFTEDVSLWTIIRNSTDALSFNTYLRFMDALFCGGQPTKQDSETRQKFFGLLEKRFLPVTDSDAYRVIKAATEAFVMVNCGVLHDGKYQPFDFAEDNAYLKRRDLPTPGNLSQVFSNYLVDVNGASDILPYLAVIRRKLPDIPIKTIGFDDFSDNDAEFRINRFDNCFGILQEKLTNPCLLELIWSYWHEEGMLVQTMNAVTRRFQNMRAPMGNDPLANLEMDPLRPLNNLIWGYIQDEQHRLTVNRRNYEYDHHYGLRLEGKAVQSFRPADTRSKFLEAFHHLLRLCTVFYKQDDDTTVKADAFPVLNALKEVHLILSQGAHNQYGDLPSTARIEMLMQQWLLARPEFREFLPTRIMVAYPEPWMDRVDAMKKLQGWTDTSVLHFRNLGAFGEQLLLSIRWGHWSDEFEPIKALNWARFFRPQAQGYIHAYRAVTGVDLSADPTVNARVDATLPSVLLKKRLSEQQRVGAPR